MHASASIVRLHWNCYIVVMSPRVHQFQRFCAVQGEGHLPPLPTTQDFVALDDHARLPWRFFGRFTASIAAGLTSA